MAEVIGERVSRQMRKLGLTQDKLAKRVGVSQPTVGRLISGESKETTKLAELAYALETTTDYLIGISDDAAPVAGVSDRQPAFVGLPTDRDPDTVELAQIDMRYGLGGTYLDAPVVAAKRQFSRAWLRQFTHTAPEHLFWALGDGDSMEPTIRSGELILIDRSQDTPRSGDGIWALAWGDIGMVKRLRPLPDGRVEIHSDNPLVPLAVAADGEIHLVGRVVAVMRRL